MGADVSVVNFSQKDDTLQNEVETPREQVNLPEAVIENFPGGILLLDRDLRVVLCNHQQKQLLQYPASLFENGNPSLRVANMAQARSMKLKARRWN